MFNIESDIENALKYFHKLKKNKNKLAVSGELDIVHPTAGLLGTFEVLIEFPKKYPYCFPFVTETSGKIERIPDRHINEKNTICLAVRPEELLLCRRGIILKWFIDSVLIPHLAREIYYEEEKEYPDGDYSHGIDGLWEYFMEEFDSQDKKWIIAVLESIVDNKLPANNEDCFCGSKKKYKKCHKDMLNKFLSFDTAYLKAEIIDLKTKL